MSLKGKVATDLFVLKTSLFEKSDPKILDLIDQVDLNIEYWKLKGSLYEKRIERLRRLKSDLFELIE